jgi:uncharacterized BrkB/YihY/UPF0761 family membrane protein
MIKKTMEKVSKVKAKFVYTAGAASLALLTPTSASAAGNSPSYYVNKVTGAGWSEVLKVAPKLALLCTGFCLLLYFANNDEHKKAKWKAAATTVVVGFGVLLALAGLMTWYQAFFA